MFATLKGLRGFAVNKRLPQLFQSCAVEKWDALPRVAKTQPRAGIGERFQRYLFLSSQGCLATPFLFGFF